MEKIKKFYGGYEVSDYGVEHGYVDYKTLSKCFDGVLCNNITEVDEFLFDNLECGDLFTYEDEDGNEINYNEYVEKMENGETVYENQVEIFQYFIVDNNALYYLKEANEIVFYSQVLDCYVWGVTHWGTSWDYVLTSIKL